MIIFLKAGEQVEIQLISEGSVQDPATMKTYPQSIVVRHKHDKKVEVGPANQGKMMRFFWVGLKEST
jgi:hypothetical protein